MKKKFLLMTVLLGLTHAAIAAEPFTGMYLQHQAAGVCGIRENVGGDMSTSRNAGVIKAFMDVKMSKSSDVILDGLGDNECTGATINKYNSNPNYYASCEKKLFEGDKGISCKNN